MWDVGGGKLSLFFFFKRKIQYRLGINENFITGVQSTVLRSSLLKIEDEDEVLSV